jgi:surface antigen
MSSADNRQSSAPRGQGLIKNPFDLPNRVNQLSPAEQSSISDAVPPPSANNRQGDAPRGQELIKNPLKIPGVVGKQPPAEQSPLPNTARLPKSGAPVRQGLIKNPLKLPGLVDQQPPIPNPVPSSTGMPQRTENNASPRMTRPLSEPITPLDGISPLADPITSPRITRHLPEYRTVVTSPLIDEQTGVLPYLMSSGTTSVRQPVVIPATAKKRSTSNLEPEQPPRKRHWRAQIVVTSLILVIVVGTLLSVVPVDKAGDHLFNPFRSISNLVQTSGGNPSSIAQQDATATVTHQDGYDPGSGIVPLSAGGAYDHFAFGQCTYYASIRYHELTGKWVPWLGNAYQWAYEASGFGWVVSPKPRAPSIIVLQPGVQGAGWFGHVAIVESINPDGSVSTSGWNWYGPGGAGWGRLSVVSFRPGPGVSFVWHQ